MMKITVTILNNGCPRGQGRIQAREMIKPTAPFRSSLACLGGVAERLKVSDCKSDS